MTYTIIYEKINDPSFPQGYFYSHIPSLGLTTHGEGLDGAKKAAEDLIKLWIEEKRSNKEEIKEEAETYFSKIVI
ncbi:MAG: type II toxin-antitoxin system HicB family antitoxin [Bacteroidetes bacterium]|nr:type II toxin-antitoxin system HicB family antitoxin [Bacteroidota bacterium]